MPNEDVKGLNHASSLWSTPSMTVETSDPVAGTFYWVRQWRYKTWEPARYLGSQCWQLLGRSTPAARSELEAVGLLVEPVMEDGAHG